MPPELFEIREWLRKAENDRTAALIILAQEPPITDVAAFHCQQAVEKFLKAFLTYEGKPFEKTHDLRRLIQLCGEVNPHILSMREAVEPLGAYAVRFRYPGPADPTIDQINEALSVADAVSRFVRERLPPEVQ